MVIGSADNIWPRGGDKYKAPLALIQIVRYSFGELVGCDFERRLQERDEEEQLA